MFYLFIFFISSCESYKKLTAYVQPVKEIVLERDRLQFIQDISFLFIIDASSSMDKPVEVLSQNIKMFLNPVFLNFPYYNYNFAVTTLSKTDFIYMEQNGQPLFMDDDENIKCQNVIPSEFSRENKYGLLSSLFYKGFNGI